MPVVPIDLLRRFERPTGYGAGVYRLRNSDADLLYIGLGASPAGRIQTHAEQRAWWGEVDLHRSTVEWFRQYDDAALAERIAIRLEQPRHNMIHSLTRPHWSHERGGQSRKTDFQDGDVLQPPAVRKRADDVILAVRTYRHCLYFEGKYGPAVAVVPVELGQLAQRVGGVDAAAQVLVDFLRDRKTVPDPTGS